MPISSENANAHRQRSVSPIMVALLIVTLAVSVTFVTMPLTGMRVQAGEVVLRGVMLESNRPWSQGFSRPSNYRGRMTVLRLGNLGWMTGRTVILPETNPRVDLVR